MGRVAKLKLENMRKANELLEQGHIKKYPTKNQVELNPSNNVTQNTQSFINKMNNLKEEDITPGTHPDLFYDDDFRKMKEKYGGEKALSPVQQALYDDLISHLSQTFASWMSPSNPAFSQEYAQPPYFDKLSAKIRDIVLSNVD